MKINKFFCLILFLFIFLLSCVDSLSVVVHIPEKYGEVNTGERFYFEVSIKYPENLYRKDLRLEYEIRTIDGDLVSQSKVLKAVETQASFIDFIVIPENVHPGLHFINVKISDYDELHEEVSATFNIKSKSASELKIYFVLILCSIFVLIVLSLIQIIRGRKK